MPQPSSRGDNKCTGHITRGHYGENGRLEIICQRRIYIKCYNVAYALFYNIHVTYYNPHVWCIRDTSQSSWWNSVGTSRDTNIIIYKCPDESTAVGDLKRNLSFIFVAHYHTHVLNATERLHSEIGTPGCSLIVRGLWEAETVVISYVVFCFCYMLEFIVNSIWTYFDRDTIAENSIDKQCSISMNDEQNNVTFKFNNPLHPIYIPHTVL